VDERGRIRTLALLARLGRTPRDELVAFRDAQLRRLVAHAYGRVAYHRRRFDERGARPGDIRSADDLVRLPTTSRRALQAAPVHEVLERGADPGRLIEHRTGGSSGRPLALYRTWSEARTGMAIRLRMLHDLGVRVSDRRAGIAVEPRPRHPRDRGRPRRALMALGVFRKASLDVRMGLPAVIGQLCRFRPDVLLGYPSVLARVAEVVTDEVRARLTPRLIVSGAEPLTPLVREQIARGFGAPVRDWYGANEVGMIAWDCQETGFFHVADHGVVLEVLAAGRPAAVGEAGEVVVTALHGFTMPFIRYALGDVAVRGPAPCPCGAPFSTIAALEGRTWDTFVLANGRIVHPTMLMRIAADVGRGFIRQFQFVQERGDRVVVKVVPLTAASPGELATMHERMRRVLGPGTDLEIRFVPGIEAEPNGKFRVARSLLAPGGAPMA
jgi:phenylacetate-CoA ligase